MLIHNFLLRKDSQDFEIYESGLVLPVPNLKELRKLNFINYEMISEIKLDFSLSVINQDFDDLFVDKHTLRYPINLSRTNFGGKNARRREKSGCF